MNILIDEADTNKMGIYKIIDVITNKFYIGSASNFIKRYTSHLYALKGQSHHNRQLQFIFNKDPSRLVFSILEYVVTSGDLLLTEQDYLTLYEGNQLCINGTFIAGRAPKHSELDKHTQDIKIEKAKQTKLSKYGVTGVVNTEDSIKRGAITRSRSFKYDAARYVKMIETKRRNGTLSIRNNALKGRKNPEHALVMKSRWKEGKLTGLIRNQKNDNNGNYKGLVTLENINNLNIESHCRTDWDAIYGINAPKMARITNYRQILAEDKNKDKWKIYVFMTG